MTKQEAFEFLQELTQYFRYDPKTFDILMKLSDALYTDSFDDSEENPGNVCLLPPALVPGYPIECMGSGRYNYDRICDDCPYYFQCFPELEMEKV